MQNYDPERAPEARDWLAADEGERIGLVSNYHDRAHVKLPDPDLHATIHVVIENQLALGEDVVVTTLARLQTEGLDRHDAIHAIGSVLAEFLYDLMGEEGQAGSASYRTYLERLTTLTARGWRGR
jgi:hypothetical protein